MDDTVDSLECPICHEVYGHNVQVPHNLDCGHTLCMPCIKTMSNAFSNNVSCPMCRKETPAGQLANLPRNYALLEILGSRKLNGAGKSHQCKKCESRFLQNKIRVCVTCSLEGSELLLCTDCALDDHNGHTLIKFDEELFKLRNEGKEKLKKFLAAIDTHKIEARSNSSTLISTLNQLVERFDAFEMPELFGDQMSKALRVDDVRATADIASVVEKDFTMTVHDINTKMNDLTAICTRLVSEFDKKDIPLALTAEIKKEP